MIGISLQQNQFEVVPQFVQSASVEVLMPGDKHQQPQNLKDQKNQKSRPQVHTLPVGQMFQACLTSFDSESEDAEAENAFYVADLGEVYRQHMRWKTLLPRIEPFYAMKCNPDPMVMRLLASLGTGFDCASKNEIQSVLDLGVDPSRIIYANPCKQNAFVKYAYNHKVRMMTFDNVEELHKIKRLHPDAQLVLRILADDSKSTIKLGLKFGAPLDTTGHLLATAQELGLDVIGVSFHVGSGCFDASAFGEAVIRARRVFDQAKDYGFDFKLLDVGGGFPSAHTTEGITFEKVAAILGPTVDTLFGSDVRVIAEPGQYYVGSAFTLAMQVIARRTIQHEIQAQEQGRQQEQVPSCMYYLNDGMYGSFNCIKLEPPISEPKVLFRNGHLSYKQQQQQQQRPNHLQTSLSCSSSLMMPTEDVPEGYASLWGPTCDSTDCILLKTRLPLLDIGDWLYFDNMGAYTITAASEFNGFEKSRVVYTTTEQDVVASL